MSSSLTSEEKPRPRHRRSRIVAAAMVVAVVLVLAACEAAGWRFLRLPLTNLLTQATQVAWQFDGDFRLHVIGPPNLRTSSLTIGAAQAVKVDYLLQANDVHLGWRWSDAWRAARGGPIVIRSLSASQLQANLVREKDGRASWALGKDPSHSDDTPHGDSQKVLPRLDRVRLGQADIRLIDPTSATQLLLSVNSAKDGQGLDARATGRLRSMPVDVTAHTDDPLALIENDAASPHGKVRIAGTVGRSTVHFDGTAGGLLAARRFDGRLRLRGPSLAAVGDAVGLTLPETPAFDLAADLAHDNGLWRLAAQKFIVGSSTLGGEFSFDARATPPLLSGRLTGRRLRLADLGPAIGGGRPASAPGGKAAGRVLPDKTFDLPSLSAMNANVKVDIDAFDLNTAVLAPFSKLQTDVRLRDGILTFNELRARAPGGTATGSMQLDGRKDIAQWTADLALDGVDVARWLQIERVAQPDQKQAAASAVPYLTGQLAARMQLAGAGQSTAQIIGSLNGQVDARINKGAISHLLVEAAGLDLAQGLGLLIKGDDALPMRCARTQLSLKSGVATLDRAVVDNPDTTIVVTGSIDLGAETLALRAVAKPKDMSLFTLRSPVRVTGPWSEPNISLDKQKLAGKALAAIVLGAVAGPAALLPFIDLGSAQTVDPCQPTGK